MLFLGSETEMLSDILVDAACAWPQLAHTLILLLALPGGGALAVLSLKTSAGRQQLKTQIFRSYSSAKGKERERQKLKKTEPSLSVLSATHLSFLGISTTMLLH
ncbi:hypothetical protein MHYP_G00333800 [Metynnis hypsauchen]